MRDWHRLSNGRTWLVLVALLWVAATGGVAFSAADGDGGDSTRTTDAAVRRATALVEEGRRIFRDDTFGDERFWTTTLGLHRAIAGAKLGGVGAGISPRQALGLGLKVDLDRLPLVVRAAIRAGLVNLDSPATTLRLLQLDAVVGVKGRVGSGPTLERVGITCALCHSDVDNSFAPGIGRRLDGWPNRDLNVGAIIAAAPDLSFFTSALGVDLATVQTVLHSWGPGRFDASLLLDGRAFRPDGKTGAVLIPAAYGLAGVNLHTYTGWGGVPHWNALVANLEMGGQGVFSDARLADPVRFPVAARLGLDDVRNTPDLVTAKLPALHLYQLSLAAPTPPRGSFDAAAAARGREVFSTAGRCATCHVPPIFTDPGWNLHTPAEIGIDDFQASRGPEDRYRTTPLRGAWARAKGGYYHDGRFPTLGAVVDHYNTALSLGLTPEQARDLVEYLKSL